MQKVKSVYRLKREKGPRKALLKSLASELVIRESIDTTEAKAKALRPYIEKTITKAKKKDLNSQRKIFDKLNKEAANKTIKEIAKRYEKRDGGYTRITKIKKRENDNAPISNIQFV